MANSMRQGMFPGMETADEPLAEKPASTPAAAASPNPVRRPPASLERLPAPTSLVGQTVWVVDANSLIFQVFHAIPEMTSPRGEPVSAVFGFTRDMLYLLEEKKPDYLFIAFDGPERTFRHEKYEAYKATRSEIPVDLVPQFDPIRRLLAGLNAPVLASPGFEADDLLATIAHQTNELGGECYLVTGDKDARQLITELVKVYNIRKNQTYDAAALKEDWGVRPEQVVDFQALVGDSVDNVPGVPLIGPKIASEYLQKFDTLDNLLEHAEELPKGKRRDNLIQFRDQAILSRELVQLDRHVPIDIEWDDARVSGVNSAVLNSLFQELGFHSFAQKFAALPEKKSKTEWAADYQCVDTPERLAWLVAQLSQQTAIPLDTETTHIHPRFAEIVGYSFAWEEGVAYYVPVKAPPGESHLDPTSTLEASVRCSRIPRLPSSGRT